MQLLFFALACAMIGTAANSASPELGLSLDVVVEVFDGKNCVRVRRTRNLNNPHDVDEGRDGKHTAVPVASLSASNTPRIPRYRRPLPYRQCQ